MENLYDKYYTSRGNEMHKIWELLKDNYNIHSALYCGSYVHITPSLYFDYVVYIDLDKKANKFFNNKEYIQNIIGDAKFTFYYQDFNEHINEPKESLDLLISLYSGHGSINNLKYIKSGGYVFVNNSHNDAYNCFLNSNLSLIATLNNNIINTNNLEEYFVLKKDTDKELFLANRHMKTIRFKKEANFYIFQKK